MLTSFVSLSRDPFYRALADAGASASEIVAAGFVDNPQLKDCAFPQAQDVAWPSFPYIPAPEERGVVLLTTGSFSPLHSGHIAMMDAARACIEAQGRTVLAGLISPSHDVYVNDKQGGAARMSIGERLEIIHRHLKDHPWLFAESWEATGTPFALNFTEVLARTQAVCDARFGNVDVVYVFGSDNVAFADVFKQEGEGVCVVRPGRQVTRDVGTRVTIAPSPLKEDVSSTNIRQARAAPLASPDHEIDAQVRARLAPRGQYVFRDDWPLVARAWGVDACDVAVHPLTEIKALFARHMSYDWDSVDVLTQERWAQDITPKHPLVSLDVFIAPTPHRIEASRLFKDKGQHRADKMVARPEAVLALSDQVDLLPKGPLSVLEDDVVSGQTMTFLTELLAPERRIEEIFTLSTATPRAGDIFDVVDVRDFILGAPGGGLVVPDPTGRAMRVPYMFPFVNLTSRASVPPHATIALSRDLWRWNEVFFDVLHTLNLKIDTRNAARVMALSGHSLDPSHPFLSMSQYCEDMARRLEAL